MAFLDLAANQLTFAQALTKQLAPEFDKIGHKLQATTVQNVSLPEELQKIMDQKIGMDLVGGIAGDGMGLGLGAGVALGQVLAQNLQAGLPAAPAAAAQVAVGMKPEDVMATLEKLADLKGKGILTQEEFDAKKAELLKKLVWFFSAGWRPKTLNAAIGHPVRPVARRLIFAARKAATPFAAIAAAW